VFGPIGIVESVGVLHPCENQQSEDLLIGDRITVLKDDDGALSSAESAVSDKAVDRLDAMRGGQSGEHDDDFELNLANSYQQSAMAISFLLQMKSDGLATISVTGGRYEHFTVLVESKEQTWWRRIPVKLLAKVAIADLTNTPRFEIKVFDLKEGIGRLALRVEIFLRRTDNPTERLVTVSLTNRTVAEGNYEERCLFQSYFSVEAASEREGIIKPYPSTDRALDEEERSLELLYRYMRTYAVGHGCAADWKTDGKTEKAKFVEALAFPTFETPTITPNIERQKSGEKLEIPMLAGTDLKLV
jgi:hypothetical protein